MSSSSLSFLRRLHFGISWGYIVRRLDWVWRSYFQSGPLTWLADGLLLPWASPWGCLSILTTWWLASPKGTTWCYSAFCDLVLEVTYLHFHHIILATLIGPESV